MPKMQIDNDEEGSPKEPHFLIFLICMLDTNKAQSECNSEGEQPIEKGDIGQKMALL